LHLRKLASNVILSMTISYTPYKQASAALRRTTHRFLPCPITRHEVGDDSFTVRVELTIRRNINMTSQLWRSELAVDYLAKIGGMELVSALRPPRHLLVPSDGRCTFVAKLENTERKIAVLDGIDCLVHVLRLIPGR
jgi:hypothetical protein